MKLTLTTFILLILSVASLQAQDPFITIWKTDNSGDSNDDQITIPTAGSGYNYDVYWEDVTDAGDNGTMNDNTGDLTITFPDGAGTYRVEISGMFPAIRFSNGGDEEKILSIEQWGDIQWESMQNAFLGASNLVINAADAPDLSGVTTLNGMFQGATSLNSDLNHWDVSTITEMVGMFISASAFNGNISGWDVSNVENMAQMFWGASSFNGDISGWNTASVTDMSYMFEGAGAFNRSLGGWNVGLVTDMTAMLNNSNLSTINYDATLTGWEGQSVQNNVQLGAHGLEYCSGETARDNLINNSSWTITGDVLAAGCSGSPFAPFITTWKTDNSGTSGNNQITIPADGVSTYNYNVYWEDVSNAAVNGTELGATGDLTITFPAAGTYRVEIAGEFPRINFNNGGDKEKILTIEQWGDVEWTSMENAFYGASNLGVNAPDAPDLSNVTSMASMFRGASSLNADFNHWDVTGVTSMAWMFNGASAFNGDISSWNVSHVTTMREMFLDAGVFNQDISLWIVSNVTDMARMFNSAAQFNQDITNWNVGNVTDMGVMFALAAAFDQNLGNWDVSNVTTVANMLNLSGLSTANYDAALIDWAAQPLQNGVALGAIGLEYCDGDDTRNDLINNFNWTITGDALGAGCGPGLPFITTWKTDNPGTSGSNQITIPTSGGSFNYDVYWEDVTNAAVNGTENNVTGDLTITFPAAGTYVVEISDDFPSIGFNNGGDKEKILTIEQWGDIEWENLNNAFYGASNLQINATDAPDLSGITSLFGMFRSASSLDSNLNHWDVSGITNMNFMFFEASSFNGDISGWNVSNVTNTISMFFDATAFDQDLGGWDVSSVTDMQHMLSGSGLSTANYDATLIGWAAQTVQNGITLGADGLEYCASEADRQSLIDDDGWTITGDALATGCNSPEGEDQRILAGNPGGHTFSGADFSISNPDFSVKIETLPGKGELLEDGIAVVAGGQVSVNVLNQDRFTWNPPAGNDHGYNYTSFEFRIVDDNANESDDAYTMSIDLGVASVELTGGEGWRFMANASIGDTYGGFLDPLWTKGVPGSDSPGASVPNIYTLDQPDYQWEEISAMSNALSRGEAFIVYVFSDDNNDGTPEGFPKTLTSGENWQPLANEFSYSSLDYDPAQGPAGDSHYLIANPHPVSLDFCGFTSTNVANSIDVWNPSANGGNGDYENLSCGVDDVFIAPFQGFWVRTTDTNPVLEIPEAAYLESAEEGYFKQKEDLTGLANLSGLTFTVQSADGIFTNTTRILFSEEASEGLDEWDAPKLSPAGLAARWLSFHSLDEDNRAYALQSISQDFGEKVSILLDIQTTEAGAHTLEWSLSESNAFVS